MNKSELKKTYFDLRATWVRAAIGLSKAIWDPTKYLSQYFFVIGVDCPLKCSFCALWQPSKKRRIPPQRMSSLLKIIQNDLHRLRSWGAKKFPKYVSPPIKRLDLRTAPPLSELVRDRTFFNYYPYKRLYNLVGGDPLYSQDLKALAAFLSESGIEVRLWCNVIFNPADLESVLPFLSEIFIYIPAIEQTEFRMFTGYDVYEKHMAQIQIVLRKKVPVTLYHPVRIDTIQLLPDLQLWARKRGLLLYLNYDKKEGFSSDSLGYITRYKGIKNVMVTKLETRPTAYCAAMPVQWTHGYPQFSFFNIQETLFRLLFKQII